MYLSKCNLPNTQMSIKKLFVFKNFQIFVQEIKFIKFKFLSNEKDYSFWFDVTPTAIY